MHILTNPQPFIELPEYTNCPFCNIKFIPKDYAPLIYESCCKYAKVKTGSFNYSRFWFKSLTLYLYDWTVDHKWIIEDIHSNYNNQIEGYKWYEVFNNTSNIIEMEQTAQTLLLFS